MKSFSNNPANFVSQSIQGLLINDELAVLDKFPQVKVVLRKNWDKSKVALISGGGSGHEPAHAGFIGKGMLTAVVCGLVFASPSVDAVLSAILSVSGPKGCLLIVKNYTGDRLNFGLAAEQARSLGHKVQMVIVGDDISIAQTQRKRGIAGTLFIHKIAGYYAQQGKDVQYISKVAKEASKFIFSIGLSISQHSLFNPKKGRLNKDQAQLGLGIHGEPGSKVIEFKNAGQLMTIATEQLKPHLDSQKKYGLMLNNLGHVTPIQMNLLLNSFRKTSISKLIDYVIGPGHFMTALDMSGFSLSVIQLNQQTTVALLSQVKIAAWGGFRAFASPQKIKSPELPELFTFEPSDNEKTKNILFQILEILIKNEKEINQIDSIVGDGDTGTTLASISQKIKIYSPKLPLNHIQHLLESIGRILSREGGGSIGVLLSIMFLASATAYKQNENLGLALSEGLRKVKSYGGANKNSRTMVDALIPAFQGIVQNRNLSQIAKNVREATEETKKITKTQFGRSSYVPSENLKGVPDPGAEAVARVFEGLAKINLWKEI